MASMDKGISHSWGPETLLLKTSRSLSHFNRADLLLWVLCVHTPRVHGQGKPSPPGSGTQNLPGLSPPYFLEAFFPHHTQSGQQSAFPHFHGLLNLQTPQCLGTADTHTMPVPHLSHMGSFCALPIDAATLVTGALTLLNPEGLLGSPTVRQTLGLVRKSGTAGLRKYH